MFDVSIVIPCYNQSRFITDAINSVFNQDTDLSMEIIVVDDCSTDNSVQIIKDTYPDDDNLTVIELKTNSKLPAARNAGIKVSQGKYIICLDGDDAIPENYISANYKNIVENSVDISYNPSQCFGSKETRFNWIDFNANVLQSNNYIHASAMYKKEIWDKVNGYDEELVYGWEDYSFWLKALNNGYKFKRTLNTFLYWRQQDDKSQMTQSVTKTKEDKIKEQLRVIHGSFYKG